MVKLLWAIPALILAFFLAPYLDKSADMDLESVDENAPSAMTDRPFFVRASLPDWNNAVAAIKQLYGIYGIQNPKISASYLTIKEQEKFLFEHNDVCSIDGRSAWQHFVQLQHKNTRDSTALSTEIYKWCAFAAAPEDSVVVWVNSSSPYIDAGILNQAFAKSIHIFSTDGSYLQLVTTKHSRVLSRKLLLILLRRDDLDKEIQGVMHTTIRAYLLSQKSNDVGELKWNSNHGLQLEMLPTRSLPVRFAYGITWTVLLALLRIDFVQWEFVVTVLALISVMLLFFDFLDLVW